MKKALLLLAFGLTAFAQTAFRVDPTPTYTINSNVPPGAYSPMLAIGGATIAINGTTYTDSTGGTACPSNAPVVPAGTSGCVSTTSAAGTFGFWLLPGLYTYTATLPSGQVLGPYAITVASGGGGGGGGCSPGGITGSAQYNNGSGGCTGNSNFQWNIGSQYLLLNGPNSNSPGLVVGVGFAQAQTGFYTPGAQYNAFQAPSGGFAGLSLKVSNYANIGNYTGALPTISSGDSIAVGVVAYSNTNNCPAYYNGSAMVCFGSGGSTSPGGANTNIQFNNTGSFGGSANLTWDNTGRLMTIAGLLNNPSLAVTSGYIQSDGGFLATSACTSFNCIQNPTGGVQARSMTATAYMQTGSFAGVAPTITSGDTFAVGAISYSTGLGCMAYFNGSAWACIGTGGGGSNPFSDASALVKKSSDATATVTIKATNVTTATNRNLTMVNADILAAGQDYGNVFTTAQTMNNAVVWNWKDTAGNAKPMMFLDAFNNFRVGDFAGTATPGDFLIDYRGADTLRLETVGGTKTFDPLTDYAVSLGFDHPYSIVKSRDMTFNRFFNYGGTGATIFDGSSGTSVNIVAVGNGNLTAGGNATLGLIISNTLQSNTNQALVLRGSGTGEVQLRTGTGPTRGLIITNPAGDLYPYNGTETVGVVGRPYADGFFTNVTIQGSSFSFNGHTCTIVSTVVTCP